MVLQANGKYNEALPWFERYSAGLPHDCHSRNLASFCRQQDAVMRKSDGMYLVPPSQSRFGMEELPEKDFNARANEAMAELPVLHKNYRYAWPALDTNGQRFFSSNMPGGYVGLDFCEATRKTDGRWSTPVNLGPEINTDGDEIAPFPATDNRLYFAPKGPVGLGLLMVD